MAARTGDGQPVGMVSAELVISTAEGGASAWMVVAKAHRRVGVGRALLGATRA